VHIGVYMHCCTCSGLVVHIRRTRGSCACVAALYNHICTGAPQFHIRVTVIMVCCVQSTVQHMRVCVLCVHVMYTSHVYTSCIHVTCTRLVYTSCIHVTFTHHVYMSCVHVMCCMCLVICIGCSAW